MHLLVNYFCVQMLGCSTSQHKHFAEKGVQLSQPFLLHYYISVLNSNECLCKYFRRFISIVWAYSKWRHRVGFQRQILDSFVEATDVLHSGYIVEAAVINLASVFHSLFCKFTHFQIDST